MLPASLPPMINPPQLAITEIMYDAPGSDTGQEWIEITNYSSEEIPLPWSPGQSSWRFFDGQSHTIERVRGPEYLRTGESMIVADDAAIFMTNYPNYQGIIASAALTLGNDGDDLTLSVDGGESWFANQAYVAADGGAGDSRTLELDGQKLVASDTPGGTPGYLRPKPSEPSPIPVNVQLRLVKISYNPAGSDDGNEWLAYQNIGTSSVKFNAEPMFIKVNDRRYKLNKPCGKDIVHPGEVFTVMDKKTVDCPGGQSVTLIGSFSLANSGAHTEISLDGSGSWLAQTDYAVTDGADGDGRILVRNENNSWRSELPVNDTGNKDPSDLDRVVINEYYPKPGKNEEEWIELYNTGERDIDMTGWTLDDSSGGSAQYVIPATRMGGTELLGNGYLVFRRSETGLILSDSADQVRLINPLGRVICTIPYSQPTLGLSWMRDVQGLGQWTTRQTPGASNLFSEQITLSPAGSETEYPPIVQITEAETTLIDQRKAVVYPIGSLPRQSGWHVVLQGTVIKSQAKSAVIRDRSGEIRVRFALPSGTKPSIHKGDFLTVAGLLILEDEELSLRVTQLAELHVEPAEKSLKVRKRITKALSSSKKTMISLPKKRLTLKAGDLVKGDKYRMTIPVSTGWPVAGMLGGLVGVVVWFWKK